MSPTAAMNVVAVIRLTPGTVIRHLTASEPSACSAMARSRIAISPSRKSIWRRHPSTGLADPAGAEPDSDGVTRTKTLGTERMARILSPRLTALSCDAFVPGSGIETTVDLDAHRADAGLDELDLGDDSGDVR